MCAGLVLVSFEDVFGRYRYALKVVNDWCKAKGLCIDEAHVSKKQLISIFEEALRDSSLTAFDRFHLKQAIKKTQSLPDSTLVNLNGLEFAAWMKTLEYLVSEKFDLDIHDLADRPYYDYYEQGFSPEEACRELFGSSVSELANKEFGW